MYVAYSVKEAQKAVAVSVIVLVFVMIGAQFELLEVTGATEGQ